MCTHFERQISWATEFWTMAPNTCGASIWTWFRITLLASRILRWLLNFWKIPTVVSLILPWSTDKIFGSVVSQVNNLTGHGEGRHIFITCFSVFIIFDLLACDVVSLGESFPTFRKIVVPSSSGAQAPNDPRTQRHTPEQPTAQRHNRNQFQSHFLCHINLHTVGLTGQASPGFCLHMATQTYTRQAKYV
jgi:hypothetical protein